MAVFIDRRELFRTLGRGGMAAAAGGMLASVLPAAAAAAARQSAAVPSSVRGLTFVRVPLASGIIPHAGETSMELYHQHPHDPREEIVQPEDIRLQTRLVMRNHKEVLDWVGLDWHHVVKLTRYQKQMEETPQIDEVLRSYFRDWRPPQTIYHISGLSSPQARLEIDMWVAPNAARLVTS